MKSPLYRYAAKIRSVYDGDTVRMDIDLGMGIIYRNQSVRLYGINAPEVRGPERPEGLITRDHVRKLISGKNVLIRTFLDKKGKYGRLLAVIYIEQDDRWLCVNKDIIDRGLAEMNTYGDKWSGWPKL